LFKTIKLADFVTYWWLAEENKSPVLLNFSLSATLAGATASEDNFDLSK
jgi:hypothetical protein